MPHSYRIQPNRQVVTFRFEGVMTVDNTAEVFVDYVHDPGFDPGFPTLGDARAVTRVEATFLGILWKVGRRTPEFARFTHPTTAAVLVNDTTIYGYVRMLEQVLDMSTQIGMVAAWSEAEALEIVSLKGATFDDLFACQP